MPEKINCIIVDDEPIARSIIKNYCGQLEVVNVVAEFGNAIDARNFLLTNKIPLVFLDINMPELSGIGFVNSLKEVPLIIFTTAYEEYAVKAFDLSAVDYLLKPFSLERFLVALDKVIEKLDKPLDTKAIDHIEEQTFFVRSDGKTYRLLFDDCLFIEAQGNYSKIVTKDRSYVTKISFSNIIKELPATFLQVHRSYVINKNKIDYVSGGHIAIGKNEIPIASANRESILKSIGLK